MAYPIVSKAEARAYLLPVNEGDEPRRPPEVRFADDGIDEEWDALAEELSIALMTLLEETKNEDGDVNGALQTGRV